MWSVSPRKAALKTVAHAPEKERRQLRRALEEMQANPLAGNVVRLTGERSTYRRKLGHWRIFFDLYLDQRLVDVVDIERRTTTTYRKR